MLPSGNDAAEALAEHVGLKLLKKDAKCNHNDRDGAVGGTGEAADDHGNRNAAGNVGTSVEVGRADGDKENEINEVVQLPNVAPNPPANADPQKAKRMTSSPASAAATATAPVHPVAAESRRRFLEEMHRTCAELGLSNTHFRNPHGMALDGGNTSTCREITQLCIEAMKIPLFTKLMSTAYYTCTSTGYAWKNTNELLRGQPFAARSDLKFGGVKTGWIPKQHGQKIWGCLASVVTQRRGHEKLLLVVMGSESKQDRFSDTTLLATQGFAALHEAH